MRNHPARVVLAACLVAASIAAQAPASLLGSPSHPSSSGSNFGDLRRVDFDRAPLHATPRYTAGLSTIERDFLAPNGSPLSPLRPQDDNYDLHALYRQNHGEFLDRMERYDPQFELRAAAFPNAGIGHEPGSFDMWQYGGDLELPVLVSTEGYLTFGLSYQARRYQFSSTAGTAGNPPGVGLDDETLTNAGLKLGFGVFLSDNWLFEAQIEPGVWSDLDGGLHHEDLDFPGHAMVTVRTLENFFFKFGARYNQVYEDAPWLPLLGFGWEIAEGVRLDLLLPEHLEVSMWPSSNLGFLWGVDVAGGEYHVRTSAATGSERANVHVQEVTTYLGLMTRFDERVSLQTRIGLVLGGNYDFTTGSASFDHAEGALDQSVFAEISLGFDF